MKKSMCLITLLVLLLSYRSANALIIHKPEHPRQPVQSAHLRNALTDVSLTQTHLQDEEPASYVRINLANDPDGSREQHHSSYHGKHVTGIVLLCIAGAALLTGALIITNNDGDTGGILGSIACGLVFIGFVIPGAILLGRYPRNRPRIKE